MTQRICCLTGHRQIDPADRELIKPLLREAVQLWIEEGFLIFLTGGAPGFDTIAGECLHSMKAQYSELELWVAVPFRTFKMPLQIADRQIILSERYYQGCYLARDRWMTEHAQRCITYFSGAPGGTAYTIASALKKGHLIRNLYEQLHP